MSSSFCSSELKNLSLLCGLVHLDILSFRPPVAMLHLTRGRQPPYIVVEPKPTERVTNNQSNREVLFPNSRCTCKRMVLISSMVRLEIHPEMECSTHSEGSSQASHQPRRVWSCESGFSLLVLRLEKAPRKDIPQWDLDFGICGLARSSLL
jgi:hypothetical protein